MKDKVLNYWKESSYRRRSLVIYIIFSFLSIFSRLFDDSLGMLSSMIAIGLVVSVMNVVVSILYTLYLGLIHKSDEKGSIQYTLIVVLFLTLVNLVSPEKKIELKKEEVIETKVRVIEKSMHNVAVLPPLPSEAQ